jgi:hypothetical protein
VGGLVRGNVQVDNNNGRGGPGASVQFNVVGGNVEVNNNSGSFPTGGLEAACAGCHAPEAERWKTSIFTAIRDLVFNP